MDTSQIIDLFRSALQIVIVMISAIVVPGLVVGLFISIFQAATQINEQTLSFIPRLLVTICALYFLGPWLMGLIVNFTNQVIYSVSDYMY